MRPALFFHKAQMKYFSVIPFYFDIFRRPIFSVTFHYKSAFKKDSVQCAAKTESLSEDDGEHQCAQETFIMLNTYIYKVFTVVNTFRQIASLRKILRAQTIHRAASSDDLCHVDEKISV